MCFFGGDLAAGQPGREQQSCHQRHSYCDKATSALQQLLQEGQTDPDEFSSTHGSGFYPYEL